MIAYIGVYMVLKRAWDYYVRQTSTSFIEEGLIQEYNEFLLNPTLKRDFRDSLYDFLVESEYEETSLDYLQDTLKRANPTLTEQEFFKRMTRAKIPTFDQLTGEQTGTTTQNLLRHIDIEATEARLIKSMDKNIKPMLDRANRLDGYLKIRITPETVEEQLYDVQRTINTLTTKQRQTKARIDYLNKQIGSSTGELKKRLEVERNQLQRNLRKYQLSDAKLTKEFKQFKGNYSNMSQVQLNREYSKLIKNISSDIKVNQIVVETQKMFKNSVAYPTNRTAYTELSREELRIQMDRAKRRQSHLSENRVVVLHWNLSPSHPITDICDGMSVKDTGYGAGNYLIEDNPPAGIIHPNCRCFLTQSIADKKKTK